MEPKQRCFKHNHKMKRPGDFPVFLAHGPDWFELNLQTENPKKGRLELLRIEMNYESLLELMKGAEGAKKLAAKKVNDEVDREEPQA